MANVDNANTGVTRNAAAVIDLLELSPRQWGRPPIQILRPLASQLASRETAHYSRLLGVVSSRRL